MTKKESKIVVALDHDIKDGVNLVEKINEEEELKKRIYGFKIGSIWVLEEGIGVIKRISDKVWEECTIILDMQKWPSDTDEIVKKQVERVAKTDVVNEIIACPMGSGKKSLEIFVKTCKNTGMRPLCVLEMSHMDSDSYLKPGYYKDILYDAASFGVDGFIVPANMEPRVEIKWHLETAFPKLLVDFYTTGYRYQSRFKESMRKFGINRYIVGREIYGADDPIAAIYNIYDDINGINN